MGLFGKDDSEIKDQQAPPTGEAGDQKPPVIEEDFLPQEKTEGKTNKQWHSDAGLQAYFRLVDGVLMTSPYIEGTKADERNSNIEVPVDFKTLPEDQRARVRAIQRELKDNVEVDGIADLD